MIRLKGRTKKGRERIKRDGDWWNTIRVMKCPCFQMALGLLVESVQTREQRWIQGFVDQDFEIVECKAPSLPLVQILRSIW